MKTAFFTATRLIKSKGTSNSGLIVGIAKAAVAISLAVMLISIAVVKGYQLQITNKITGFSNHIQISRLDFNNSFEANPFYRDNVLEKNILANEAVANLQPIITKAGIIKTKDEIEGVVLKGINKQFDWKFISSHLVKGSVFQISTDSLNNGIVISETLAKRLNLDVNQPLVIYFIQDDGSLPRARKFNIAGIYSSGFDDLDALYGIIDLRHIQKLNKWDSLQISGYEVQLKSGDNIELKVHDLLPLIPYHLQVKTVYDQYPQLFDWLNLLDLNVVVIIILMVIVAAINMSTALLILIVERSNMIGVLKAMGGNNRFIQQIFLVMACNLILKGLFWGNLIGLSVCFTQYYFGWIKLNQEAYFLSSVPIELNFIDILAVNAGAFILCLFILLLPARMVSNITPAKSIRFQ